MPGLGRDGNNSMYKSSNTICVTYSCKQNRRVKCWPLYNTNLYSEELLAEEVLRLRAFLLRRARLRPATSPPSQVEQQYGAASTRTSSAPSISDSQAASKLTGHISIKSRQLHNL